MDEIIQSFISSVISSLTSEATTFLEKKLKNWKEVYFNSNIADYLSSMNEKFSVTKTFLHQNNPENFRKRYFNVLLKNKDVENLAVTNVDAFFKNNNFVSIISSAGTGKTMFVKNIFLKTLEQKNKKIPIEIVLREVNSEGDCIEKYISNKLKIKDKEILEMLLDKGKFLFLFDGYDEISFDNKKSISKQIENFVDKFHENFFLVTSRPGAGLECIPRFKEFTIKELDILQIKEFIKIQIDDKDFQNGIISIIDDNSKNHTILEYLRNPLLLSMFIFTFKSYPEIPKSRSQFYWNVYDTLCNKHDSTLKFGGYQHERKSKLKNEEITAVLEWFAYKSFFESQYSFNNQYFTEKLNEIQKKLKLNVDIDSLIYDLNVSVSIIIKDGLEYKFPHKTLQEYFVARLIEKLDEEKKEKIYSEIIPKKLMLVNNTSFLDLCKEIDKICFKKFFLRKNIISFLSEVDLGKSDIDKCKIFLRNIYSFSQSFRNKNLDKDAIQQVGHGYSLGRLKDGIPVMEGIILSISSYISNRRFFFNNRTISKRKLLNLVKEIGIDLYGRNDEIYGEYIKLTDKNVLDITEFSLTYNEKVINSSKIEELLIFTDLISQILDFIKFLKDEVKKIEQEIKEQEDVTCNLLDL